MLAFSSLAQAQCVGGANAIGRPLTLCAGRLAAFTYEGDTNAMRYVWVWGDGDIDSTAGLATNHTYADDSVYHYQFIRVFTNGCRDTLSDSLVVGRLPDADFSFGPDSICPGGSISFTNTSGDTTGATFRWTFDDPASGGSNTSTQRNPSHTFNNTNTSGYRTFNVKLVVTNPSGCKDSITRQVSIKPRPDAEFSMNDSICSDVSLAFTNNTQPAGGISYSWDFGDPSSAFNTSTGSNPSHVYTNSDTSNIKSYTVKLRATNAEGCSDSVTHVVRVQAHNVTAEFAIAQDSLCSGLPFQFNNQSHATGGNLTYAWNFGDWASAANLSSATNPTHSYNDALGGGYAWYTTSLVATTPFGCADTISHYLRVKERPDPQIEDSCNGNGGTFVQFTNCSGTILNPDFEICVKNTSTDTSLVDYYRIIWGDGHDTILSPEEFVNAMHHTYHSIGSFNMRVEAHGKNGCVGVREIPVINESNPSVGVSTLGSTTGCAPATFNYVLSASNVSPYTRFLWNFGDNQDTIEWDYTQVGDTIAHRFDSTSCPNQFIVSVTAVGLCGSTSATVSGTRVFERPRAEFDWLQDDPCAGVTPVQFNITSGTSYGLNCNQARSARWDFGDGTTSTSQNPSHVYDRADTFNVRLILNNGCGADTIEQQVIVDSIPTLSFYDSLITGSGCIPATIKFIDSSSGGNLRYQWSFIGISGGGPVQYENGTTDSSAAPIVTFFTAGIYRVGLQVTNPCGVRTLFDTITISRPPDPNILAITNVCGQKVFTPAATVDTGYASTTYLWAFPGGSPASSTSLNPGTVTYSTAGTYTVKLYATNQCGVDSAQRNFTVHPLPVANFGVNDSGQCFNGHSFTFTDSSFVPSGTITNRQWNFGDGNTSTATNPTKTYASPGTYTVRLIVTTNNNCRDTITRTVRVFPRPSLAANINDTDQCLAGNSFSFTDNSTVSSGTIATRIWYFGDGDTSSASPAIHTYDTAGTYTVKLRLVTDNGCADSITRTVQVYPQPVVRFGVGNACEGVSLSFTDSSTVSSGAISSRLWRFGDGTTSANTNPTKTYAIADTFNVRLIITTDRGCRDSLEKPVEVYPTPNTAFAINDSTQCFTGNTFNFTNNSTLASGGIAVRQWTFGDSPAIDTSNSPTHSYAAAGTYQVKLVLVSNNNCRDSATKPVEVYPMPVARFGNTQPCFPSNVIFTDSSVIASGTIASRLWDFGDTTTSTAQNPAKGYNTAGSYQVKLVVTSNQGCKDSVTHSITINPLPDVAFGIDDTAQCLSGNSFAFTDSSTVATGSISSRQWKFGDGTASSALNPTKTYASAGTYTVTLLVTTNNNCVDSVSRLVHVFASPAVRFGINDTDQCLSINSFAFTDSTTVAGGTVVQRKWYFGDGDSSTAMNPVKTYTSIGVYTVRLIVTSNEGCVDSARRQVQVAPQPVAKFGVNDTDQCSGQTFTFTDSSTTSIGTISSRNWTFGDGNSSPLANPSKSYAAPGSYTVKLVVANNSGCMDSVAHPVEVFPRATVVMAIDDSTQCIGGNQVQFQDNSNVSAPATIASRKWSFGDGDTAVIQNPLHTYAAPNTYQVKLVLTTSQGCIDSIGKPVVIFPQPVAKIGVNDTDLCFGLPFMFTDSSTIASGTIASRTWTFGDGNSASTITPTHTYAAEGTYTVKLVITSNNGCKDSITRTVIVRPNPDARIFINPASQCFSGNLFAFRDTSVISSGSITGFSWTFGDGNSSSARHPGHSYGSTGTFGVKLVVASDHGCIDSATTSVVVTPQPTVNFGTTAPCFPAAVTFSDSSGVGSGSITGYHWDFGDGDTSNLASPTHSYTSAGNYNVQFTVITNSGCGGSANKVVSVFPKPQAAFAVNDSDQCFGTGFTFTDNSTVGGSPAGITSRTWTFGDGTGSSSANPSKSYTTPGTYTVTLRVASGSGCIDSVQKQVIVYSLPVTRYGIDDSVQCLNGNLFTFNDSSAVSGSTITSRTWTFGDGNSSPLANITHSYVAPGTYQVKLVATSAQGCKDSATTPVRVAPMPVASFLRSDTSLCLGLGFNYTDNSSIVGGTISQRTWRLGNGTNASGTTAAITYGTHGTFNVKLIVVSTDGCADSITRQVQVNPIPVAKYGVNDSDQCRSGNSFAFSDSSTIVTGSITQHRWTFGDGGTSAVTNPIRSYASVDTFDVKLVVTSDYGCKDSVTRQVIVYPQPVLSFTNTAPCYPSPVNFNDTVAVSSGSIAQRSWRFGDGNTANTADPSHTYTTSGNYTVWLVATTNQGCKDSFSRSVIVNPKPRAGFRVSDTALCLTGNSFAFTDTSSVVTGTITSRQWTFGDGNGSSATNPVKTYTTPGTYTVKLKVTTNNGCQDSVMRTLVVHPMPVAALSVNDSDQCISGNSFVFNSNSTVTTGSIAYRKWYFGDGDTSNINNPTHTYAAAGNYTLKLVVTTDKGCKDSTTKPTVIYPKPTVGFRNIDVCHNVTSVFTDTSTVAAPGIVNAWKWYFGTGDSSAIRNPNYTYADPGTYTVRLIATTNHGCRDSSNKIVTIFPRAEVGFSYTEVCYPNTTQFADTSKLSSGSIALRRWSFHDATTASAINTTKTYAAAGTYAVKLVLTTDKGCRDSISHNVPVRPLPAPAFSNIPVGCRNVPVAFNNSTTGAVRYEWDFGNGDTSQRTSPNYAYADTGVYTIKVRAFTNYGCVDSTTRTIHITEPPFVSFTLAPDSGCGPLNVAFTNNSSGYATSYSWNFGNGQTSASYSPGNVTFVASTLSDSVYLVKLTGTNLCGPRTDSTTVQVMPRPLARFGMDYPSGCTPLTVNFTNLSKGLPDSVRWDFGDGTFSSDTGIRSHIFYTGLRDTVYYIHMTVYNECGWDSITMPVHVQPKNLRSLFMPNVLEGCAPLTVNFTNFAKGADVVSYDFDDGNLSTELNPTHTFIQPGTYYVRQFVVNTCTKDTSMIPIVVKPIPVADFTIPTPRACANAPVQFFNTSPGPGGTTWYFGDGDTSLLNNPTHSYRSGGWFRVTLKFTSNVTGCWAFKTDSVYIDSLPLPSFTATDVDGCQPLATTFTNTSNKADYYVWKFGDGNTSTDPNPSHTYFNSGYFLVKLIAYSNLGCIDSVNYPVNVYPIPVSAFEPDKENGCGIPVNVQFINNTTGAASYRWDLDNGQTSTNTSPAAAYNAVGTYNITLISTSAQGCKDTAYGTFNVYPQPNAEFTFDPPRGCQPLFVSFTNASTNAQNYSWNFGDGETSAESDPEHWYMNAGTFSVRLIAYGQGICTDTMFKPNIITVTPKPTASFTYNIPSSPAPHGMVHFNNTSLGAVRYVWDFGDGDTSTARHPHHRYKVFGAYTITLISFSQDGCSDTTLVTLDLEFFGGLFVPDAFTPESGGPEVRVFKPVGVGLRNYHLRIFNTYGELMWETKQLDPITGPAEGWDGYYHGTLCQQDVYVWKIDAEFIDGRRWPGVKDKNGRYRNTGTVTLIR